MKSQNKIDIINLAQLLNNQNLLLRHIEKARVANEKRNAITAQIPLAWAFVQKPWIVIISFGKPLFLPKKLYLCSKFFLKWEK
jgi:hypothetical protein